MEADMGSKRPWFKFHAKDWQTNVKLGMCSLQAKGLLIDLMAIAHDAEPYGYLVAGGEPITPEMIAHTLRAEIKVIQNALNELVQMGRLESTEDQIYYIPRMVRDHAEYVRQSTYGQKGGNPATLKGGVKGTLKVEQSRADKSRADGFDQFWEAYPRKVGKQKAKRAWGTHKCKDHLNAILASIAVWKSSKDWADPKFIPHPTTWLNRGGWEDEPIALQKHSMWGKRA